MTSPQLNKLLGEAASYCASDLHLIAGVPPAYRVNGEIILADQDALTAEAVTEMAMSMLNELQREKFEREWELCISMMHATAGRGRVTFYRRRGHPRMSFRVLGERIRP